MTTCPGFWNTQVKIVCWSEQITGMVIPPLMLLVGIRNYEGISDHVKDNILYHNPKKLFALNLDGKIVRSAAE